MNGHTKRQARLEYRKLYDQAHEEYEAFLAGGETDEGWERYREIRERRNAALRAAYSYKERLKIVAVRVGRCLRAMAHQEETRRWRT